MLSKKDIITWGSIILIGCFSVYSHFQKVDGNVSKYGYVDINAVFAEFDLKKELEQELLSETSSMAAFLDSLKFDLQLFKTRLEGKVTPTDGEIFEYQKKQKIFFENKQAIEKSVQQKTADFDEQIIGQMTQYIKDYGIAHSYEVIFGEDQTGNILYGDSTKNITNEVIGFINNKFQGKI